ncbi:hypothetical protein J1N35_029774 [Gossypium stocksii]|uniref:Uncharacterized protein n=1 Tax=Gossypium stocksii TaxID=47602 RepID=A0A9D3UYE5_9ROSI|nr:hypothetical protein J1N35_029774 [Gossypium stocksii]
MTGPLPIHFINVLAYVDILMDLELLKEKRKLDEEKIVTLASKFIDVSADTTSTNLRVLIEIKGVAEDSVKEIKQDEMLYLKLVILEGLIRHLLAHFVVPYCVTEKTLS